MSQNIFQQKVRDEAYRAEHTIEKETWNKQQLGKAYGISIICYPPVEVHKKEYLLDDVCKKHNLMVRMAMSFLDDNEWLICDTHIPVHRSKAI